MVQIRNVPDDFHRELKARAARAGISLSDYVLSLVRRAAERATPEEIRARLQEREPVNPCPPSAEAVREERDRR